MILNNDIVEFEKNDGISFPTFVVNEFSGLFLHPSIYSIKHSRSAQIINGALSDFSYWLNPNILVSSKDIIILQKSLLSHTLLWYSSLLFVLKEWRQFSQ